MFRSRTAAARLVVLAVSLACSGCLASGAIDIPLDRIDPDHGYRPAQRDRPGDMEDIQIYLAFSGGGTRAASFAYGVMKALHETPVQGATRTSSLLEEVDTDKDRKPSVGERISVPRTVRGGIIVEGRPEAIRERLEETIRRLHAAQYEVVAQRDQALLGHAGADLVAGLAVQRPVHVLHVRKDEGQGHDVGFRRHRPDLEVTTVDVEPTGIAVVTGLDPGNTLLHDHHDEILADLADLDFDALVANGRDEMLAVVPGSVEVVGPLLGR